MKQIPLSRGKYALVDDEDYDYLNQWKWSYSHYGYAIRTKKTAGKQHTFFMHRELLKAPKNSFVDHINSIGIDNRKSNIRVASVKENSYNRRKFMGTSIYKGVHWKDGKRKWCASIYIDGKARLIGYVEKEFHAAMAYDIWAKDVFGDYAWLNF